MAQGLAVAALEERTAALTPAPQAAQAAFMAAAAAPEEHLGQEALEPVAQFALYGPVTHDHSHQLVQEICNESIHSS